MTASPWRLSDRADPAALLLADRHYSRQKPGTPQFVQPGRCLVLLTADGSALWVTSWPFAAYVHHAWPGAWVNSWFRNEGGDLSSDLIHLGVAHTRAKWPDPPARGWSPWLTPPRSAISATRAAATARLGSGTWGSPRAACTYSRCSRRRCLPLSPSLARRVSCSAVTRHDRRRLPRIRIPGAPIAAHVRYPGPRRCVRPC